jgi:maltose O-acetyltransferase
LLSVAREELAHFNPGLHLVQTLGSLLPDEVGGRVRTALLRRSGIRIGAGTIFNGQPAFSGGRDVQRYLDIGSSCWFNVGCRFDIHAAAQIGDGVRFGQEVLLLTHTHHLGPPERRAGELQAQPVKVGAGAWIGARVTILPGVSIGSGAVIAAGAVVAHDVAPNTLVGGVPARPIRDLSD